MRWNKKNSKLKKADRDPFEILVYFFVVGFILCIAYPAWTENYLRSLSVAMLLALTATAVGGLCGFLFGIPRLLQSDSQEPDPKRRYQQNTNLEQVSDWLTKILVGIGLTQLGTIATKIQSLSEYVAKSFPSAPANSVFSGLVLIYFATLGFFLVYLWSRLQFVRALGDADSLENPDVVGQMISILDEVEGELSPQQQEAIAIVRKKLEGQLESISGTENVDSKIVELANSYEKLRRDLPAGRERTKAMGGLVAIVRNVTATSSISAESVFKKGGDGNRIVALGIIRAAPKANDLDILVTCILEPRSPFEQFQALRAAEALFAQLDEPAKQKLRDAMNAAVNKGYPSQSQGDSDRMTIIQRLLK